MKTVIEFGGFYGSIHEALVEQTIESYFGDDNGELSDDLNIDWHSAFNNYIKEYAKNLSEWLVDEYGIEVEFNNLSLYSPREYNFKTDTIHADLSELDAEQLKAAFKDNKEFLSYLQNATQSYDGYISFYTYADALADKDGILMQYLLRWLCDLFNESELMSYFDRNCSYDHLIN
jgi:hypothetical protein